VWIVRGLVISLSGKKAKEGLKAMHNEGLFSAIIGDSFSREHRRPSGCQLILSNISF